MTYKQLETEGFFSLLNYIFGSGEGGVAVASARAEPGTGGAAKGRSLQLQEVAHLKGKFRSQEKRGAAKSEVGLESSSRALRGAAGPLRSHPLARTLFVVGPLISLQLDLNQSFPPPPWHYCDKRGTTRTPGATPVFSTNKPQGEVK